MEEVLATDHIGHPLQGVVDHGLFLDLSPTVIVGEPGGVVVIYTDGITEATDYTEEAFGVERLKETIASNASLPAKTLVDLIFQRVEDFSRRHSPRDDQTIVVARRPAPH